MLNRMLDRLEDLTLPQVATIFVALLVIGILVDTFVLPRLFSRY